MLNSNNTGGVMKAILPSRLQSKVESIGSHKSSAIRQIQPYANIPLQEKTQACLNIAAPSIMKQKSLVKQGL
jgi:hypothetical protein